jgi:hypothetical protein
MRCVRRGAGSAGRGGKRVPSGQQLPDVSADGGGSGDLHRGVSRGHGRAGRGPARDGVWGRVSVRLLHAGICGESLRGTAPPGAHRPVRHHGACRQPLPMHWLSAHSRCGLFSGPCAADGISRAAFRACAGACGLHHGRVLAPGLAGRVPCDSRRAPRCRSSSRAGPMWAWRRISAICNGRTW